MDVDASAEEIRKLIGVVFQNPSLDKKLTIQENLMHQGHFYGLRGPILTARIKSLLERVGIHDRANDIIEHLSGGMQRRVELAKGMLHEPRILLLDEPSTGLDPGARIDFDQYLLELKRSEGVTIVLTTHILDEAEHCDRLAILDKGNIVALGSPSTLTSEIGGDVIKITTADPTSLMATIAGQFGCTPDLINGAVHLVRQHGHEFIPRLFQAFQGRIDSVSVSRPTLEDVFIKKTGHQFWQNQSDHGVPGR